MSDFINKINSAWSRPFVVGFLVVLTLAVQPWRNSVSQDDSAYAYSAISWSQGSSEVHAGNVAMVWPQLGLGWAALKISPFKDLPTLNFLTWLIYLTVLFLAFKLYRLRALPLLTFFVFPLWVQYGASYLSDIYTAFLLICLMALLALREDLNSSLKKFLVLAGAGLFSYSLGVQVQSMAALPFFWGAFYLLRKERRPLGLVLIVTSLLSILTFLLMEKTPYQQGYGYWMARFWIDQGPIAAKNLALVLFQILLAISLYLIPALNLRRLKIFEVIGVVAAQVVFVQIYKVHYQSMSAGVFFTTQISNTVGLVFMSFGFWGMWAVYQALRQERGWKDSRSDEIPLLGTLLAMAAMWLFCAYRMTFDIRYFIPWMLPILFHLSSVLRKNQEASLGAKWPVFAAYAVAAVLLNSYNLTTTQMRWDVARELRAAGTDVREISAGVGHDSFHLETSCINRILPYLTKTETEPLWKSKAFFERIINRYNKSHGDDWVPRYIIKPSQMMGKRMSLLHNRLPGQDGEPYKLIDYSVYGFPNQLAVFRNEEPRQGWCFRLPEP